MKSSAKPRKNRLSQLSIDEVSFVDSPAVEGARFLVAKRHDGGAAMDEIEKRIAMQGYTGSAAGATTPAHIHEYYSYLDRDTGQMSGHAAAIADHSHRITPESYARGETEESDGHLHALMTIKEARALVAAGLTRDDPKSLEKICSELTSLKDFLTTLKAAQPMTTITEPNGIQTVTLSPEHTVILDKIIAAHGAHTG